MSVDTQTHANVHIIGGQVVWGLPQTLDGWLALPEHESALCPKCDHPGAEYCGVWVCVCDERWRWPGLVGGD